MIKEKIQSDQIQAMKAKDRNRLETLRYILAQIKNKEIDKQSPVTDEEAVGILRRQIKEIDESIAAFVKGNRADLVGENEAKRTIIASYLPAEISDEELKKEITRIIDANKELHQKTPKAIIGLCVKELKPKADPSRILKLLQELV